VGIDAGTRGGAETIRALATVTLDARAIDELGPEAIDRIADRVEARLMERRAAGEEVLLTPVAAAEIAGVHPETMRRAVRLGTIEVAGYVGARARLRRAAVDAWVAGGRRSDPSVAAARLASRGGRGSHPRVLRAALDGERAA
jgi:excisionase family DNA binding protein